MTTLSALIGFALLTLPLSNSGVGTAGDLSTAKGGQSLESDQNPVSNEASEWVAESEDHICGLSSLRKLSNPAEVDYADLWEATPEIKEMNDGDIEPDSAEGIRLQKLATDRIFDACKEVMEDESYCSVWKDISHKDERDIRDLTDLVKEKFTE